MSEEERKHNIKARLMWDESIGLGLCGDERIGLGL
jgi:hypothetical protein